MKKSTQSVIAVFGTVCCVTAVQAQEINPSWYIQPSVSVLKPDSDYISEKTGLGGGLRFGAPVAPNWDVQMGVNYARSREKGLEYRQGMVGADALYLFSRSGFRPFVLVGVGAEKDYERGGKFGTRDRISPYASVGLGFQAVLNDQWSLQMDARRVHGFLRGNVFPHKRSENHYINIGLNYAFDKPPVVAAMKPVPLPAPVVMTPPPPPPLPQPAPPAPPPEQFEKIVLSATELFKFDSATLSASQPKLDEIASLLQKESGIEHVTISGYADRLGSERYNRRLSQQRAEAVKAYLTGRGVAASRLKAEGKGATNPTVQCHDRKRADLIKCLEPNRRVEVEKITFERRMR